MQQTLEDFYKAARAAGIKISTSDSIETSRTVALVGYKNRNTLKSALQVSLAKTETEHQLLNECFEQFFNFDGFSQKEHSATLSSASGEESAFTPDYQGDLPLAKMLIERDEARLAMAMKKAARDAGVTKIWFFTQKSIYTQKIMQQMGVRELQKEAAQLGQGDCPSSIAQAGTLREAQTYLYDEVRDFVEKQLAMYGKTASKTLREDHLKSTKLTHVERRDFHTMHEIVRKMAKRLSALYSKKQKQDNRGQLDFRKTLRNNVAYDGILFNTYWKTKTINKPRILALCDVSGSVQAYSRFLLLFLYSLNDVLDKIDSYVYTGHLSPVNNIFDRLPVEQAVDHIMDEYGLGGSDYGVMLKDLEDQCLEDIDNKTTVLVLGDARNNRLNPRTEIMQQVYQRAKRVIWLNPELEAMWGTGDSEMLRYRPYTHLTTTCNTLSHLERMLDNLLKAATSRS